MVERGANVVWANVGGLAGFWFGCAIQTDFVFDIYCEKID